MRVVVSVAGILVLLLGSLLWGQGRPARDNRRGVPAQQNPADFAPDPPPIGQPAPPPPPPTSTPAPPVTTTTSATPAVSPAPTPAVAPENLPPATAPQVTFRDGLLTVMATNSNLNALLTSIRNKTGIQFEGMENSTERVAISIGPAPEGEVLAAILGGSNFDYVVVERPDSPGIVQRVLLTPKGGTAVANTAAGAIQPGAKSPADADDDDDESDEPAAPQDTPVRPPVAQVTPQQQTQPPQQAQPRSADQMYEELKKGQGQPQPSPSPSTAPIKPH